MKSKSIYNCTAPEEYIKECILNDSDRNISKYDLQKIASEKEIHIRTAASKQEIVDVLAEKISYRTLAGYLSIGVPSIVMQRRFHITNEITRFLAEKGLFHIVGKQEFFNSSGQKCMANLYDIYDYYELDISDIISMLYKFAKAAD